MAPILQTLMVCDTTLWLNSRWSYLMRDPPVSSDHVSLAHFMVFQGKYQEAEPCMKRSLAIRQTLLGPDHPAVAQSLNGWAGVLIEQVMFSLGSGSVRLEVSNALMKWTDTRTALQRDGLRFRCQLNSSFTFYVCRLSTTTRDRCVSEPSLLGRRRWVQIIQILPSISTTGRSC